LEKSIDSLTEKIDNLNPLTIKINPTYFLNKPNYPNNSGFDSSSARFDFHTPKNWNKISKIREANSFLSITNSKECFDKEKKEMKNERYKSYYFSMKNSSKENLGPGEYESHKYGTIRQKLEKDKRKILGRKIDNIYMRRWTKREVSFGSSVRGRDALGEEDGKRWLMKRFRKNPYEVKFSKKMKRMFLRRKGGQKTRKSGRKNGMMLSGSRATVMLKSSQQSWKTASLEREKRMQRRKQKYQEYMDIKRLTSKIKKKLHRKRTNSCHNL
jgi:hypothetical protein